MNNIKEAKEKVLKEYLWLVQDEVIEKLKKDDKEYDRLYEQNEELLEESEYLHEFVFGEHITMDQMTNELLEKIQTYILNERKMQVLQHQQTYVQGLKDCLKIMISLNTIKEK